MLPFYTLTLPVETEIRKRILALSLAKPRENIKEILKTNELFIYDDILHYQFIL
jgi:hypothetical protein